MSDQDARYSDLAQIAKRSKDFSKVYGPNRGAFLTAWLAHVATRGQPVLRPGWLIALAGLLVSLWKLWPA